MSDAVTVVIPVLNGRRTLPAVLAAIADEVRGRPFQIVVVDDGSADGSLRYLRRLEAAGALRVVEGPRAGPAAAVNRGIREASHGLICQIDQDVIVRQGWLAALLGAMADGDVAAAQGRYTTADTAGFWGRVMGRDLERRYDSIGTAHVDHVCTGNTVYRAAALHQVGLLDESFGYGADNDLSYRLTDAGYRLAFCPGAMSVHVWRDHWRAYLRQQFGVGYGRLDVVHKHPRRVGGDAVSGLPMILHAAGMFIALVLGLPAAAAWSTGVSAAVPGLAAVAILACLALERFAAGVAAWRRSRDPVALAFPAAHLARDVAWACAIAVWSARRLSGMARSPRQSLPARPRPRAGAPPGLDALGDRVLVLIPAHNECASLPRVMADLARSAPGVDVLVVDDGSDDGTRGLLAELGVGHVTLPLRVGIGGALRAGILYAVRHRYRHVVRMDGDGQHRARDIAAVLEPITRGRADAVVGSRYVGRAGRARRRGVGRRVLALGLGALTGRAITDPTSGFWVFGPRALALLSRCHPTGYPEPELRLLLHRHGLRVEEVGIRVRPRHAGRTTLTWPRAAVALARTLLAFVIVPLRPAEPRAARHGE